MEWSLGACTGLGQGWGPKPCNFIDFCPIRKVGFIKEAMSGYLVVKTLPRYLANAKISLRKLDTKKKLYGGSNWPESGQKGHFRQFKATFHHYLPF